MFRLILVFVGSFAFVFLAGTNARATDGYEEIPTYYDSRTGNITIDATEVDKFGGYAWGLKFDGFNVENYTPFMNGGLSGGWTPTALGETDFATVTPGVYSLGEILPVGLSPQGLDRYFVDGYGYANGIGTGTSYVMAPVYSPSPFRILNDSDAQPGVVERWATEATLRYDASTGSLTLGTTGENGGHIFSYALNFTDAIVNVDAFQSTGTEFPSVSSRSIVEAGLSFGGISEGEYDLGKVLPAGLVEDELLSLINQSRTKFIGEPGHSSASLDLDVSGSPFALAYTVPEPSTLSMFVASVLFVLTFVSRRSR